MLCKELGHPNKMVMEDIPSSTPKENEVLLSVKACSVNFPDTLMVQGLYQFKPDLPFSPGSDVSGIIKAVGANIKHLKPGDEAFGIVSCFFYDGLWNLLLCIKRQGKAKRR